MRKYKWLVFEQVLSEWNPQATPDLKVVADIVSRDQFLKHGGKFKQIVPSAEARFESGDLCFGALLDGKYVHIKWVGLDKWYDSDVGRYLQLGSDSAYVYDGYTLSEYRGLGLTSVVLDETFQYLQKNGIKKAYSLIDEKNAASLRVKFKENARIIGTVTFFKIFGLKLLRVNGETAQDHKKLIALYSK
jgi:GNAT superfamily N-acetyltransferase